MKLPNINCKYYNLYGYCIKEERKKWGLLKQLCIEVEFAICKDALRYNKPKLK